MPPFNEADAIASMVAGLERRIDQHDKHIDTLVHTTVAEAVSNLQEKLLAPEERAWVRLAVEAQAQRVKLRQAIIDKTLTALVWVLLAWIATVLFEYAKAHGWKP